MYSFVFTVYAKNPKFDFRISSAAVQRFLSKSQWNYVWASAKQCPLHYWVYKKIQLRFVLYIIIRLEPTQKLPSQCIWKIHWLEAVRWPYWPVMSQGHLQHTLQQKMLRPSHPASCECQPARHSPQCQPARTKKKYLMTRFSQLLNVNYKQLNNENRADDLRIISIG